MTSSHPPPPAPRRRRVRLPRARRARRHLVARARRHATCKTAKTKYPNANPGGYFTSLKVTKVSCSSGAKLMVAYYKCRRKKGQGIEGKCKASKVNGMKCTESRPASGRNPAASTTRR